jgi:hypothetical protein
MQTKTFVAAGFTCTVTVEPVTAAATVHLRGSGPAELLLPLSDLEEVVDLLRQAETAAGALARGEQRNVAGDLRLLGLKLVSAPQAGVYTAEAWQVPDPGVPAALAPVLLFGGAEQMQWRVVLRGCPQVALASCGWQDVGALHELVDLLHHPEEAMTLLGMVDERAARLLTAQGALEALLGSKALPEMSAAAVGRMLQEVPAPYDRAKIRALRIGRSRPLAVAVSPRLSMGYGYASNLVPQDLLRVMTAADRISALGRAWGSAVGRAGGAEGWSVVDLPAPADGGRRVSRGQVVWLTRLDPQVWESVSPAVQAHAANLNVGAGLMVRGSEGPER